jgi:hypothetical protein
LFACAGRNGAEAGEVLMVAQPIAFAAQNGPLLVAELRRKCRLRRKTGRDIGMKMESLVNNDG